MNKTLLLCALLALSACAGADGRVDVLGTAGAGAVAGGIAGLVGGAIARDQQGQAERRRAYGQPPGYGPAPGYYAPPPGYGRY